MTRATLLCGTLALALAGTASAKDFSFDFKTIKPQDVMAFPGGYGVYGPIRLKSESTTKQPKPVSSHPLYGRLGETTNGTGFAFRLDESQGDGKGYDRLIVDLNRNSDLTDDPVIKPVKLPNLRKPSSGAPEQILFGPIEAPADCRIGKWQPVYFAQAYVYNRQAITNASRSQEYDPYIGSARLKAGWYLETTVRMDGVRQKIGLVDGDANLRLGEPWTPRIYGSAGDERGWYFTPGDSFLVDANGSGRFEDDAFDTESCSFGPVLYLGALPYKITLASDRKSLSIDPWSGPLGELALGPRGDQVRDVTLAWEGPAKQWQLVRPAVTRGTVKVPVGRYRLYGTTLEAQAGKNSQIRAAGSNRSMTNTLTAEAGKATALAAGAPLEIKVTAGRDQSGYVPGEGMSNQRHVVRVNGTVTGVGGEVYSSWGTGKDFKEDPPKPSFTIAGKDGKQIASGNLEFG
jgi:hypothetical protein